MSELLEVKVTTSLGSFETRSSELLEGAAGDAPPNPLAELLLGLLRPSFALRSPLGSRTVAPYGEPFDPLVGWLVVGAAVFGVLVLVRKLGR